jgi:hypothetical protein
MTAPSGDADPVDDDLGAHIATPGALLPILHDVQDALGYASDRTTSIQAGHPRFMTIAGCGSPNLHVF